MPQPDEQEPPPWSPGLGSGGVGYPAKRRPRSVWNTAAGVEPGDEALLEEWHKFHPVKPWKGHDGKGGFIGWANRLDERAAQRGYLMSPRSEVIPVSQRDIYHEVRVMLRDWRYLALLPAAIAGLFISPFLGGGLLALLMTAAAKRVRVRTRGEIRVELNRRRYPNADRLNSIAFDLTAISASTRLVVDELLTATLASPGIANRDIEAEIGCTREELAEAAGLWASSNVMSLATADHIWMVVSKASTLDSWRQKVPGTPDEGPLTVARDELDGSIHQRVLAASNNR